MEKLNLLRIVRDHVHTLKDYNSNKYSWSDFLLFLMLPLVIAAGATYCFHEIGKDLTNVLITSLSVFAGLLFNLLLLIYDIVKKANPGEPYGELKTRFLKEIYSNISFSILVAILTVILLLLLSLSISSRYFQTPIMYLIYFLVVNFILTLFMILRRVHILLSKEFEKVTPPPAE